MDAANKLSFSFWCASVCVSMCVCIYRVSQVQGITT